MGIEDNRIQYLHDAEGNTTAVLVPIELSKNNAPKDDSSKYTAAQLAEIEEGIADYKAGRVIEFEVALDIVVETIRTGIISD